MKREFRNWDAFELLQPEFEGKLKKIELPFFFFSSWPGFYSSQACDLDENYDTPWTRI